MNTIIAFDLDGCLVNPKNYFIKNPPPEGKQRGDAEYNEWLERFEKWVNLNGIPNYGVKLVHDTLYVVQDLIYLTSREEQWRSDTITWMKTWGFPYEQTLVMRPNGDLRSYAQYKVDMLEQLSNGRDVILFDDDPKGELAALFQMHSNWTLFKTCNTGSVP